MRKIINGFDVKGSPLKIEIDTAGVRAGLEIFHEYSVIAMVSLPRLREVFQGFVLSPESPDQAATVGKVFYELIRVVNTILDADRIFALAGKLLKGAQVGDQVCDENGMCPAFDEDPILVYVAVFWALVANYPKYFGPFSMAIEPPAGSTPGSPTSNG